MFHLIEKVDHYYKTCDNVNPTMFIDESDLDLYREYDNIEEYTEKLFKKVASERIAKKKLINHLIVCYVLSIKFYTDCWISAKPYTFIIDILGNTYDWLKAKNLSRLEKKILQQINYVFD